MISIEVKSKGGFSPHFGYMPQILDAKAWQEIGQLAYFTIFRRTFVEGRDTSGKPFAPYSAAYAKKKGSSFVDLTLTGALKDSIRVSAQTNQVRLATTAAYADSLQKTRPFFDVSEKELDVPALTQIIARAVDRIISGGGGVFP